MAPKASRVQQFILHALVPILCSLVVGYYIAGFGLWIGFAVGAGITLADRIFSRQSHAVHAS